MASCHTPSDLLPPSPVISTCHGPPWTFRFFMGPILVKVHMGSWKNALHPPEGPFGINRAGKSRRARPTDRGSLTPAHPALAQAAGAPAAGPGLLGGTTPGLDHFVGVLASPALLSWSWGKMESEKHSIHLLLIFSLYSAVSQEGKKRQKTKGVFKGKP